MDNNLNFHDDNILARFFGRSSNYTDIPNSKSTMSRKDFEMMTVQASGSASPR